MYVCIFIFNIFSLMLKALSKLAADNIKIDFVIFHRKIRFDILCESADDSHEMSNIFSEK